MPEIWSEVEKTEISNAVSVFAYRDEQFKNIEELITYHQDRLKDGLKSEQELESDSGYREFEYVTKDGNLEYKSRALIRIENDIGYVLGFTATPGTYDKNLPKFQSFVRTFKFTSPQNKPVFNDEMNHLERAVELTRYPTSKNMEEAMEETKFHLSEHEDDVEAVKLFSRLQLAHREYENAIQTLAKIRKLSKPSIVPGVMFQEAQCYFYLQKYELAQQRLNACWAFYQDHPSKKQRYQ